MEVTFEREPNGTWLLLSEEAEAEEYACRLLERNPGRHLLRLTRRKTPEGTLYAFEIPGGNSLAGIFRLRAITFPEIRKVMLGLSQALEEAEASLLPAEHLILEPELIFCLPDMDHVGFCCHPGVKRDFFDQLRKLIRYFLQKMDHQDGPGTEALYRLAAISEQEYFRFEELMEVIGKTGGGEKAEEKPSPEPEPRRLPEKEPMEPERSREGGLLFPVILLAAGLAGTGAGFWLRSRGGWWDWRLFLLPCCLTAVAAALLLRWLPERWKDRREKKRKPGADRRKRPGAGRPGKNPPEPSSPATAFLGETAVLGEEGAVSSGILQLIPVRAGAGEAALIRRFPFVIGKLKGETDLLLDFPSVSRLHARIECREGQLSIRDCRSTNGTWVNGIRLEPEASYPLNRGDEIRFADVRYRLE